MHDVFLNKLSPSNISNLFDCSNEIHNYNKRFPLAGNYHIKYSKSNQLLKSFSRLGAKVWNVIPQELRKLAICIFKKIVHNRLLQISVEEDDYVGIPSLIIRFQNNCSK